MKESAFIRQNREKWKHYEEVLKPGSENREDLDEVFIQVTDDLSYARTFYPNRSVRVYLNQQAQSIFLRVYKTRPPRPFTIIRFFRDELPLSFYRARHAMLVCFFIFLLTFLTGVFSSRHDPGFARQILGDDYVDMTLENIRQGKPMAVYSQGEKLPSFLGIALNNLKVDLLTFVTGLFLGVGSVFVLAYNGVMVGVFQYFFYGTGYLLTTILTIWLHGTLEISAMILSATAGMVFGRGLLFPGTYSRLQAFRISAVQGIRMFLSVVLLTLIAAVIEAYITPLEHVPVAFRILLIVLSAFLVLFYFVWYPYRKFAGAEPADPLQELTPPNVPEIDLGEIKSAGQMVAEAFWIWRVNLNRILPLGLAAGIMLTAAAWFMDPVFRTAAPYRLSYFSNMVEILKLNSWFRTDLSSLWVISTLLTALLAAITFRMTDHAIGERVTLRPKKRWLSLVSVFLIQGISLWTLSCVDGVFWFIFYIGLMAPLGIFLSTGILHHGYCGLIKGWNGFFRSVWRGMLLNASMLLILFVLYLVVTSPVSSFLFDILANGLKFSNDRVVMYEKNLLSFTGLMAVSCILPVYIFANILHYYSISEKLSAAILKEKLKKFSA